MQWCKRIWSLFMSRIWRVCIWIWAYECRHSLYHTVLFVLLSCIYPFFYIWRVLNLAPFMSWTCFFTVRSHRQLIVQCIFLSPLFSHLAMECLMWGVKSPAVLIIMTEPFSGMLFSLNLIWALLRIVCIPRQTDRPLFSESLFCPGRWKRPLCASSPTPQWPDEIFTGQHLVWDQERRARDMVPPKQSHSSIDV